MSLCFNVTHLLSEHVFTNDEYKKYLYMDSYQASTKQFVFGHFLLLLFI